VTTRNTRSDASRCLPTPYGNAAAIAVAAKTIARVAAKNLAQNAVKIMTMMKTIMTNMSGTTESTMRRVNTRKNIE
jgi:hypothetical protein